jgi:hypothetical protein
MSDERLVIEQMGVASVQLQDAMRANGRNGQWRFSFGRG